MFLILHKVRGEPAFDIAEKLQCPLCTEGCEECNNQGYWWTCSTSGHRARPYKWWNLDDVGFTYEGQVRYTYDLLEEPPPNWPDHYATTKAKEPNVKELFAQIFGHLPKPEPSDELMNFKRRV